MNKYKILEQTEVIPTNVSIILHIFSHPSDSVRSQQLTFAPLDMLIAYGYSLTITLCIFLFIHANYRIVTMIQYNFEVQQIR